MPRTLLNTGVLTRLHSIVGAPARRKESGRASSPPRGIPSDGAGRLEQLVEPALLVELHDAAQSTIVAAAGVDAVDPDGRDRGTINTVAHLRADGRPVGGLVELVGDVLRALGVEQLLRLDAEGSFRERQHDDRVRDELVELGIRGRDVVAPCHHFHDGLLALVQRRVLQEVLHAVREVRVPDLRRVLGIAALCKVCRRNLLRAARVVCCTDVLLQPKRVDEALAA